MLAVVGIDDARGDNAGFTLVEMLVALLVLGVVLAATAASLTSFSRQVVVNERRVQATAYLTTLHESLQALDWELAVNLDTDVEDLRNDADQLQLLADLGVDLDVTDPASPQYAGEEIVVIEECPEDGLCLDPELADLIPALVEPAPEAIDGRTFDSVITLVTWVGDDTSGPRAKRFVTYVTWTVLRSTFVERFESVRAPTATELAEAVTPDIVSFQLSPATVRIDEDGRPLNPPEAVVEFNRGMDLATVVFPCWEVATEFDPDAGVETQVRDADGRLVGVDPPDECSVTLGGEVPFVDGRPVVFSGVLELPSDRIWVVTDPDEGPAVAEVSGTVVGQPTATRTANVSFVADDGQIAPTVQSVVVNPSSIVRRANGNLCPPGVTVTATILDLEPDGIVSIEYPINTGTGRLMEPNASRTVWTLNFAAGTASPWIARDGIRFTVTASNGDAESSPVQSNPLTVTSAPNCN